ncbi:MAG: flagellar basal body P-ring protein FlgI, partial [Planctomycetota bacterium]
MELKVKWRIPFESWIAPRACVNRTPVALLFCMTGLLLVGNSHTAWSAVHVGDICRVKGQERNTLQGMGLVVGLSGTGDGDFGPTARGLIQIMRNMGVTLDNGQNGTPLELDASNTALVVVTAEVPPQGGRQGDEFGCTVSAVNAESLEGGTLLLTPLLGPSPPPSIQRAGPTSRQSPPQSRPEDARVYAVARGPVKLDDSDTPTSGEIVVGCRLEEDFMNPFVQDNKITVVLNRNHARFEV